MHYDQKAELKNLTTKFKHVMEGNNDIKNIATLITSHLLFLLENTSPIHFEKTLRQLKVLGNFHLNEDEFRAYLISKENKRKKRDEKTKKIEETYMFFYRVTKKYPTAFPQPFSLGSKERQTKLLELAQKMLNFHLDDYENRLLASEIFDNDLREAKEIIIINRKKLNTPERAELVQQMLEKFEELNENYAFLTAKQKLFLFTLTLNLMLHFHEAKDSGQKLHFKHKTSFYFGKIFLGSEINLTPTQKAKWSAFTGKVNQSTQQYETANTYFQQGISFIEHDNASSYAAGLKLQLYMNILELNMFLATHYETTEKAPDLAEQANKRVIAAVDSALPLMPKKTKPFQLYSMKITALNKIAHKKCAFDKKMPRALFYWKNLITTIETRLPDLSGKFEFDFFLNLLTELEKNFSTSEYSNEKFLLLRVQITKLKQKLMKTSNSTPFWTHAPAEKQRNGSALNHESKALTDKSNFNQANCDSRGDVVTSSLFNQSK